jgi:hypothetical protein
MENYDLLVSSTREEFIASALAALQLAPADLDRGAAFVFTLQYTRSHNPHQPVICTIGTDRQWDVALRRMEDATGIVISFNQDQLRSE